jgi:hypothetical protein
MFNPFESPWLLLIIGILTLAIGSWIRNNLSPRKGLWLILAGVLIAAAAFAIDYAVVTDYEQVWGLIDTCKKAAVAGDVRPMGPCISEQYKDSVHPGKSALLASADRIFKTMGISKIRFQSMTLQISQSTAQSDLNMAVFLDPQKSAAAMGGLFFVEISVQFRKENNRRWFIASAELESVNNDRTGWNIAR